MLMEAGAAMRLADRFRDQVIQGHNKWFAREPLPPEIPADHTNLQQQAGLITRAIRSDKVRITLQVTINPEL